MFLVEIREEFGEMLGKALQVIKIHLEFNMSYKTVLFIGDQLPFIENHTL